VESGAIGRLVAYYATYYTNPVKPMPPASTRPAGMSDVEWQIRNWYNFVWLCGDSLVEQAVHSVDKIAWAMHDEAPVSCVGVGGRAIPAEGGNIFDHLDFDPAEAESLRLRSELMRAIEAHVIQSGLTQAQAAKTLGVSQPRLNDLLRGRIGKFSLDALVNMLAAMGRKVQLTVRKAA